MKFWTNYKSHKAKIEGAKKKFDNTIYTFDIESTSYIVLNNKQLTNLEYESLTEKEQKECLKKSTMYIWQFSIDDEVYFGRTWDDFTKFLNRLDNNVSVLKYVYVHNLSFEFQFLKDVFHFDSVTARKSHKVMTAKMKDYNIMFKCSLMLSNVSLAKLTDVFLLPVSKKVGELDYTKIRHSKTELTEEELEYCEYDCKVLYHYIKRELETYKTLNKIPTTSTAKVRRELFNITINDYKYKDKVRKSINTNPHVYNLLVSAFQGGYTHANYIYADTIIKNVDSYDITSSYPYVMTTCKYPSSEFKKCNIKSISEFNSNFAYLLKVKFTNIESKYLNNIISSSRCEEIKKACYDNGRIISAESFITTLTDIDFKLILDFYKCDYEILEIYYSKYNYLPKKFIDFVLDKYVLKTKYKNDESKELEYQREKAMFNSLYGMSVTNMIKDDVIYDDDSKSWFEKELTNDKIIEMLESEKKKAFLSFSYGVWVTAYARDNLLRRVKDLDDYVIYCDTDSIKLCSGYDKNVFSKYNISVENKIKLVCNNLNIKYEKYAPKDIFNKSHLMGVFEIETKDNHKYTYDFFITQGAKKYASMLDDKIKITVSGVPKKGANALKSLKDFKDDFVFKYKDTNKNTLMYCENMAPYLLTDYNGVKYLVNDKSGCCLLPASYKLKKALDYANLINDSSNRAIFKE